MKKDVITYCKKLEESRSRSISPESSAAGAIMLTTLLETSTKPPATTIILSPSEVLYLILQT